jgi:hypothetical protein
VRKGPKRSCHALATENQQTPNKLAVLLWKKNHPEISEENPTVGTSEQTTGYWVLEILWITLNKIEAGKLNKYFKTFSQ